MMSFKKAYKLMKEGHAIKRAHWAGFWKYEDNTIKMYCKNGDVIDIKDTQDIDYTITNCLQDDWITVDNAVIEEIISTITFGEAVRQLKNGKKLARKGWNGKDMFVVYQKAYPTGIPCNKQTADAWGLNEGDLFRCEPYLQIKMVNGSHAMWVPSINDVLAEDWFIVE